MQNEPFHEDDNPKKVAIAALIGRRLLGVIIDSDLLQLLINVAGITRGAAFSASPARS